MIREFGSEYDNRANDAFLHTGENAFADARCYRSGRDALKAVAAACAERCSRVLLPALCCESMAMPFLHYGIQPVFYRLNRDYTAVVADVADKLTADSILLYQPYFGIAPFTAPQLEQLRRENPRVLFLEDRTHDLLLPREAGFAADITVASLRKWTAIPDGGLLWSSVMQFLPGRQEEEFAALRRSAMEQKATYLATGDAALKDSYRAMLSRASELLDASGQFCAMTPGSAELLPKLDTKKMLSRRQENAHALHSLLQQESRLQLITDHPERSTLYFPVLVEDQARIQRQLAQRDVYCPVIWPVPEQAQGICPVAEYTAQHMLAVPCDHRYTPADMEYIANQIRSVCHEQ